MSALHHTREYQACVVELKARGRWQQCISCAKILDATVGRGHPKHMTLGHHIDVDVAPELAYDPNNYGPQCEPCNAAGGARITNAKRKGVRANDLLTSPDWG